MRVFWSVLVMAVLSATEASTENWNEGRYAPTAYSISSIAARSGSGVSESLSPCR